MRMVFPGDPGYLNPAYPRQELRRASAGDGLARQPETGTKKIGAECGKRKFQLPGTLVIRSFPKTYLHQRDGASHSLLPGKAAEWTTTFLSSAKDRLTSARARRIVVSEQPEGVFLREKAL